MRRNDVQLGKPQVLYKDTKANIEVLTGLAEGSVAYATDTNEQGSFNGTTWDWGGGSFDLADAIHSATSDSTFHDDDEFAKSDSQDSWGLKKFTWANVKTALKSYFDTLYQAIGGREVLTADRTYYVRTDGNDSNTGLANTAGGAFLTIQKAVDVVAALDLSIYNVTIQVADGTYTGTVRVAAPFVGKGTVTLQGNNATPANVLISVTANDAIRVSNGAIFTVKDLKITTTASGSLGHALYSENGAILYFSNINFGSVGLDCITCVNGNVEATGNYSITAGCRSHLSLYNGVVRVQGKTITITGTPAWSGSFVNALGTGTTFWNDTSFSGSATGKRYNAVANSVIYTNGGGANFLPGNAAGTTATGGQYI